MSNKINVLVIEPDKNPYTEEVDNTLSALQNKVGETIQVIYPYNDLVGLVCDNNGKPEGKPLNRFLATEDGEIYDVIVGIFLIVGLLEDDFCSLTLELIEKYTKLFEL